MMLIVVVVVDVAIMTMWKYSPCSGICFHANPKTNTGHKHVDGFDGVCGDKKNDDGGGDGFVAILFGGGGNVSN